MKKLPRNSSALLTIALAAILVSCAPQKAFSKPNDGTSVNSAAVSTAGTGATSADIAARLSKLGFHVFPEPVALPPFTAEALDPAAARLDSGSLAGTVTLLNFWATWCPPCRREMPSIERLSALMKESAFRVAAVNVGEKRDAVTAFMKKEGYTFPVYLDPEGAIGSSLASQGIPTTYILDASGRVVAGTVGSREYDDPALVAVLKDMAVK
jgi:thiol-disulfide isomerase/thioredoxin